MNPGVPGIRGNNRTSLGEGNPRHSDSLGTSATAVRGMVPVQPDHIFPGFETVPVQPDHSFTGLITVLQASGRCRCRPITVLQALKLSKKSKIIGHRAHRENRAAPVEGVRGTGSTHGFPRNQRSGTPEKSREFEGIREKNHEKGRIQVMRHC